MKVFSKHKMMERLRKEYLTHKVDDECLAIMDMLDGKEVHKNDFKALVFDQIEYFIRHEGEYYPINPKDCIEV